MWKVGRTSHLKCHHLCLLDKGFIYLFRNEDNEKDTDEYLPYNTEKIWVSNTVEKFMSEAKSNLETAEILTRLRERSLEAFCAIVTIGVQTASII